jgi:hypothetical protein
MAAQLHIFPGIVSYTNQKGGIKEFLFLSLHNKSEQNLVFNFIRFKYTILHQNSYALFYSSGMENLCIHLFT